MPRLAWPVALSNTLVLCLCLLLIACDAIVVRTVTLQHDDVRALGSNFTTWGLTGAAWCDGSPAAVIVTTSASSIIVTLPPNVGSVVRVQGGATSPTCSRNYFYVVVSNSLLRIPRPSGAPTVLVGQGSAGVPTPLHDATSLATSADDRYQFLTSNESVIIGVDSITSQSREFIRAPLDGFPTSRDGYALGWFTRPPYPEAYTTRPLGLSIRDSVLFVVEGSPSGRLRRCDITAPYTMVTILGTSAGTMVDGSFDTAVLDNPLSVTSLSSSLFVVGDRARTRLIDVSASLVTSTAGIVGQGLQDGLLASAMFGGPLPTISTWADRYSLIADTGNDALRLQLFVRPAPLALVRRSAVVDLMLVGASMPMSLQDQAFAVHVSESVWILAPRGRNTIALVSGDEVSLITTPVDCTIGGLEREPVRNTFVVSCSDQNVLLQFDVASRTFDWWCGMAGVPQYVDSVCGDLNGARFQQPQGMSRNGSGIFVADETSSVIRFVDSTTRRVSTVAGNGTRGTADGPALEAMLFRPVVVAACCERTLYVGEPSDSPDAASSLRHVNLETGIVSSLIRRLSTGHPAYTVMNIHSLACVANRLYIIDSERILRLHLRAGFAAMSEIGNGVFPAPRHLSSVSQTCAWTVDAFFVYDSTLGNVSLTRGLPTLNASVSQSLAAGVNVTGDSVHDDHDSVATWRLASPLPSIVSMAACFPSNNVAILSNAKLRLWSKGRTIVTADFDNQRLRSVVCGREGQSLFVLDALNYVIDRVDHVWEALPMNRAEVYGVFGVPGQDDPFLFHATHLCEGQQETVFVSEPAAHRILAIDTSRRQRFTLIGRNASAGIRDGLFSIALLHEPGAATRDRIRDELYFFDGKVLRVAMLATEYVRTITGKFGSLDSRDGSSAVATFANPLAVDIHPHGTDMVVSDGCSVRTLPLGSVSTTIRTVHRRENCSSGVIFRYLRSGFDAIVSDLSSGELGLHPLQQHANPEPRLFPTHGDACVFEGDRDGGRSSRGVLGNVTVLATTPGHRRLFAIESTGYLRELGHEGSVRTLVLDRTALSRPTAMAVDASREAFFIVNFGRNNILRVGMADGAVQSISGPTQRPFGAGHTYGGAGTSLYTGPIDIVAHGNEMVVLEREGNRGRYLDLGSMGTAHFFGDPRGRPGSNDGSLAIARLTLPRALCRRDFDAVLFVAERDRLRVVSAAGVTTLVSAKEGPGLVDGPHATLQDVTGIGLNDDGLLIVDAGAVRLVDQGTGSVRTIFDRPVGHAATRTGYHDVTLGNPSALWFTDSRIVMASECVVYEAHVIMRRPPLTLRTFAYASPTISRSHSDSLHDATDTDAVTASHTSTRTPLPTVTPTWIESGSPSQSERSISVSPSLRHPSLVALGDFRMSVIRSLAYDDVERDIPFALLGTQFDTSNESRSDFYVQMFNYLQLTVSTDSPDRSSQAFASRSSVMFSAASVVRINTTHLVLRLLADPFYFAFADETLRLTVSKDGLKDKGVDAMGECTIVSDRVSAVDAVVELTSQVSAFSGGAVSSLAAKSSTLAGAAPRVALLYRVSQCRFELDQPLPRYANPVSASLGQGPLRFHRATMVMNPVLVVAFLSLHFVVTDYVRYYSKRPRRQCMGAMIFPSLAIIPVSYFLQSTTTAALLVIAHDTNAGWQIAAGVTIGVLLACVCCLAGYFVMLFRSVYTDELATTGRSKPCLLYFFFGSGTWEDVPTAEPSTSHRTAMHAAAFERFRPGREWYGVLDMVLSLAAGWAGARVDSGVCTEAIAVLIGVATVQCLGVLLLRPFSAPFDTLCGLALACCQLVAAAFVGADRISPSSTNAALLEYGEILAVSCLYFISVQAGLTLLACFGKLLFSRREQRADHFRKLAEDDATGSLVKPQPDHDIWAPTPGAAGSQPPHGDSDDDNHLSSLIQSIAAAKETQNRDMGGGRRPRRHHAVHAPVRPTRPSPSLPTVKKEQQPMTRQEYSRLMEML